MAGVDEALLAKWGLSPSQIATTQKGVAVVSGPPPTEDEDEDEVVSPPVAVSPPTLAESRATLEKWGVSEAGIASVERGVAAVSAPPPPSLASTTILGGGGPTTFEAIEAETGASERELVGISESWAQSHPGVTFEVGGKYYRIGIPADVYQAGVDAGKSRKQIELDYISQRTRIATFGQSVGQLRSQYADALSKADALAEERLALQGNPPTRTEIVNNREVLTSEYKRWREAVDALNREESALRQEANRINVSLLALEATPEGRGAVYSRRSLAGEAGVSFLRSPAYSQFKSAVPALTAMVELRPFLTGDISGRTRGVLNLDVGAALAGGAKSQTLLDFGVAPGALAKAQEWYTGTQAQQSALEQMEPYKAISGGYYIGAAIAGGVPRGVLLTMFSQIDVTKAAAAVYGGQELFRWAGGGQIGGSMVSPLAVAATGKDVPRDARVPWWEDALNWYTSPISWLESDKPLPLFEYKGPLVSGEAQVLDRPYATLGGAFGWLGGLGPVGKTEEGEDIVMPFPGAHYAAAHPTPEYLITGAMVAFSPAELILGLGLPGMLGVTARGAFHIGVKAPPLTTRAMTVLRSGRAGVWDLIRAPVAAVRHPGRALGGMMEMSDWALTHPGTILKVTPRVFTGSYLYDPRRALAAGRAALTPAELSQRVGIREVRVPGRTWVDPVTGKPEVIPEKIIRTYPTIHVGHEPKYAPPLRGPSRPSPAGFIPRGTVDIPQPSISFITERAAPSTRGGLALKELIVTRIPVAPKAVPVRQPMTTTTIRTGPRVAPSTSVFPGISPKTAAQRAAATAVPAGSELAAMRARMTAEQFERLMRQEGDPLVWAYAGSYPALTPQTYVISAPGPLPSVFPLTTPLAAPLVETIQEAAHSIFQLTQPAVVSITEPVSTTEPAAATITELVVEPTLYEPIPYEPTPYEPTPYEPTPYEPPPEETFYWPPFLFGAPGMPAGRVRRGKFSRALRGKRWLWPGLIAYFPDPFGTGRITVPIVKKRARKYGAAEPISRLAATEVRL